MRAYSLVSLVFVLTAVLFESRSYSVEEPPLPLIIEDTTLDEDAIIGPPEEEGWAIHRLYLSDTDVSFEIDYPGSPHTGANQVLRAIAVYRKMLSNGSIQERKHNVSGDCSWSFSDSDVYDAETGEFGNLESAGLLISWIWGPSSEGTTDVTVTYQQKSGTGTITATDSRP